MHALTGWIPEITLIQAEDPNFNSGDLFERLRNGLSQGICMITLSIKELPDEEAQRAGLVANHAYAVLDLREIDVS